MKTVLLLLISSILSGISAYSQTTQVQAAIPYEEFIARREQAKLQRDEHTPLVTVQRCTSTATYTNNVISDTTQLTYTHPRGSNASKNAFNIGSAPDTIFRIALNSNQASVKEINEYDAANKHIASTYFLYGQQVGTTSNQYHSNGTLQQQEYDYDDGTELKLYRKSIRNNEGLLLYDTTYQNTYTQQTSMNYFVAGKYDYDQLSRVTQYYSHMAFNNYNNVLKSVTKHYYAGNSTQPFLDSIFNYLSNGSILKSARKFYYHPDGRNLIDTTFTGAGNPTNASQYTYNGAVVTTVRRSYNGSNWSNTSRNISQNNNDGLQLYSRSFNWITTNNSWQLVSEDSAFYNAAGYLIRHHTRNAYNSNNQLQTAQQHFIERNSYNNTYKWTAKNYSNGAVSNETTNLYYFEDYDNGLSLKPLPQKIRASIYPNPVQTSLKVHIGDPRATKLSISIYKLSGKTISRVPVTGTQQTLDISHLPAGTFILTIQDQSGTTLFSQKILKQ